MSDRRDSRSPRRDRSRSGGRDRSPYNRDRSRSPAGNPEDCVEIKLDDSEVAYLLGRGGQTKQRLANFSGCRLEFGGSNETKTGEIWGTPEARELAQLAINITLQQRSNGRVTVDFDELEARPNCSTLDVPMECVGFLLGAKGNTLRTFETKYRVFMFFDNEHVRDNTKRLYILGDDRNRQDVVKECEDVIRFKLTGESKRSGGGGGGGGGGYRGRSPPRRRRSPSYDRRDRDRRRSYSPRRRSPSRDRRRRSPSPYDRRDRRR